MNVGGIFLIALVVVGTVGGLFVVASKIGTTPYVDYHGNTTDSQTNATQRVVGNVTAPVATAGAGVFVFIAILALCAIAGVAVYIVTKRGGGGYTRSRYY